MLRQLMLPGRCRIVPSSGFVVEGRVDRNVRQRRATEFVRFGDARFRDPIEYSRKERILIPKESILRYDQSRRKRVDRDLFIGSEPTRRFRHEQHVAQLRILVGFIGIVRVAIDHGTRFALVDQPVQRS